MSIRSNAIRRAARGEICTVRIPQVCRLDHETTVLAHLADESGGMGRKSDDISAVFACHDCHDVIDGRAPRPQWMSASDMEWLLRRALVRTLRRLIERGIVAVSDYQPVEEVF